MASEIEKLVQKATSMGDLCEQGEINSEFMQQFVPSNGRFSWKQLQGENSRSMYTAAIEGQIHDYSSQIHQIDLTVTLIWRSLPGGTRFYKYCKCSHNSFQSKVPWSQLLLLSTKFATDAWCWECAFPSRFCWFTYMGKVHVMSTDLLGESEQGIRCYTGTRYYTQLWG